MAWPNLNVRVQSAAGQGSAARVQSPTFGAQSPPLDCLSSAFLSIHKEKRQGRPPAVFRNRQFRILRYFLLTAFFSSAPGVNFATLRAAILMVAPVCGLRPLRAFLADTEKVPKPISATRSPLRRAEVILSTAVSIAVVACALLISHAPAILSTRSALFIVAPRRSRSCPACTGRKKLALTGLGNLTARIVLPLMRMSTVKIRAGSLFRNPSARISPTKAPFALRLNGFPPLSTKHRRPSQDVHRSAGIPACAKLALGAKSEQHSCATRNGLD